MFDLFIEAGPQSLNAGCTLASEQLGKSANSSPEVEHPLPTASALENQIHQQGVIVNRAIQSPQEIQAGVT
jgi:hypothetical protein